MQVQWKTEPIQYNTLCNVMQSKSCMCINFCTHSHIEVCIHYVRNYSNNYSVNNCVRMLFNRFKIYWKCKCNNAQWSSSLWITKHALPFSKCKSDSLQKRFFFVLYCCKCTSCFRFCMKNFVNLAHLHPTFSIDSDILQLGE